MITIIGDTHEELAVLQSFINTGILNDRDMSGITFDATYKLSSGNVILTDRYGNIVGEKPKDCRACIEFEVCLCGKNGHENGTSIGYSVGNCKDFK